MYCRKCGFLNEDNAFRCVQCGQELDRVGAAVGPVQRIPNYLAQSILVTLFCCVPFGIVAIVYSAQVNGKVQAGDIQGAMASSGKARMWAWLSFGIGFAWVLVYAAIVAIGAATGNMR